MFEKGTLTFARCIYKPWNMTEDEKNKLIGQKFEAWSASGEYFLGKGIATGFSEKSNPPKHRVMLDNRMDIPVFCLRPLRDERNQLRLRFERLLTQLDEQLDELEL